MSTWGREPMKSVILEVIGDQTRTVKLPCGYQPTYDLNATKCNCSNNPCNAICVYMGRLLHQTRSLWNDLSSWLAKTIHHQYYDHQHLQFNTISLLWDVPEDPATTALGLWVPESLRVKIHQNYWKDNNKNYWKDNDKNYWKENDKNYWKDNDISTSAVEVEWNFEAGLFFLL